MDGNIWLSLSPLVGVVVGASLHFAFTRAAESRKQTQALRNQCYVDYLRSVANLAHAENGAQAATALREAADAKARIAIYGTAETIAALARFEATGANLATSSALDAFVRLAATMRGGAASEDDLRLVLFGTNDAS